MRSRHILSARARQHTLRGSVSRFGVGLHTGRKVVMTIRPAAAHHGICFRRRDVADKTAFIPARWNNVVSTERATVLANEHGVTISTIEHVLAALRGCGVDNALIEVDGPEIPIFDGSAGLFVEMIDEAGITSQDAERWALWIQRPVVLHAGERYALLMPDRASRITAEIDFPGTAVGHQRATLDDERDFRSQFAAARTFGFSADLDNLVARGLALGGSLANAVLVDGKRVVNPEGLRFADEFVRHKVIDCLGDLALIGVPLLGHFYAHKPGHALTNALIRKLFADSTAWSFLPISRIDEHRVDSGDTSKPNGAPESALRIATVH